jgi:hypothetical protein
MPQGSAPPHGAHLPNGGGPDLVHMHGGAVHYAPCPPYMATAAAMAQMGPGGYAMGYGMPDPQGGGVYPVMPGGHMQGPAPHYAPSGRPAACSGGTSASAGGAGGSDAGGEAPPIGCAPDAYKLFCGNVPMACTEQVRARAAWGRLCRVGSKLSTCMRCMPLLRHPQRARPTAPPSPARPQDIWSLFTSSGCHVIRANILRDKVTRESKGCAFVWCRTKADADYAAATLNGCPLAPGGPAAGAPAPGSGHRPLVVRRANPPTHHAVGGGGGGGGGGSGGGGGARPPRRAPGGADGWAPHAGGAPGAAPAAGGSAARASAPSSAATSSRGSGDGQHGGAAGEAAGGERAAAAAAPPAPAHAPPPAPGPAAAMTPQLLAQMSLLMQVQQQAVHPAAQRHGHSHNSHGHNSHGHSHGPKDQNLLPLLQAQKSGDQQHHHHRAPAAAAAHAAAPALGGPKQPLQLPSQASGPASDHGGSSASTSASTPAAPCAGAPSSGAWGTGSSAGSSAGSMAGPAAASAGAATAHAPSPRPLVDSRAGGGGGAPAEAAPRARAPRALLQQSPQARGCTQEVLVSRAQMHVLSAHLPAVREASGAGVVPTVQTPNSFSLELSGSSQEVRAAQDMIVGALERQQVAPRVA